MIQKRLLLTLAALSMSGTGLVAQTPGFALDSLRVQVTSRTPSALPSTTRAVRVITAIDIARAPARTVAEVLSAALGLDVLSRSAAQTDLSIRGGSFEQVLVLVDGMPMSDPQTGHFDLDLALPLAEIERIEVLSGGASALYGSDAMTGVVNIVTRRGGRGWEASGEHGTFGTLGASASAAGALGAVHLRGGAEFRHSDGHRAGTDFENVQGRLAAESPIAGGALRAEAAHAMRDFGAANFYAAYPSYEETRTTTAALSWTPLRRTGTTVEPRLSFRRHQDDFVLFRAEPARYRNLHESRRYGGEVVVRRTPTEQLGVAAGGDAYEERLESSRLGDHAERRMAVFAELSAGAGGAAALTGGLRYDHHSTFGGFWAPSVAAAFWPRPAVRLRASATRGFRSPTLNDRFYEDPANVGNPELGPERSQEVEVGLDVEMGHAGRVGLSAFRRSASDLIDWVRPVGAASDPWRTRNVAQATFRGVEAEYTVRGPADGRWSATAALLTFESAPADGYVSKYALRPLREVLAVAVEQRLVSGSAIYARGSHARRSGESPHFLLDGRLTLQRQMGELFVDGRNLTNAVYRDVSVVPANAPAPAPPGAVEFIAAPGRAVRVGLAIRSR